MRNHTRKIHSHKKTRKIRGGGIIDWFKGLFGYKKPDESSSDINSNGSSAAREITSQSQPTTVPTTPNATPTTTTNATQPATDTRPPNMGGKRRTHRRRRH